MRGITTMHYRKAFVRHFGGLDAEMAPFIPTVNADKINPKLLRDVLPENNSGLPLIPQLIGNQAADFVNMAKALHDLGYEEVNWNLGCPHKPVRKKQRGSGLLPHPERIDALLETICAKSPCKVSVKVRLGVSDKSELMNLIPILNRHPLSEVIVHPRTAEQVYDGTVDLDAFAEAYAEIKHPVCYNGDITDLAFFQSLEPYSIGRHSVSNSGQDTQPSRREALDSDAVGFQPLERFMIGRGLLANPFLCEVIKENAATHPGLRPPLPRRGTEKSPPMEGCRNGGVGSPALPKTENAIERLGAFHDEVLANYQTVIDGDVPMLGKMKEFWAYPATNLSNGRKLFKKIKKANRIPTYQQIVKEFLAAAEWMA